MTTPAQTTYRFKVSSLTGAGERVVVQFGQVVDTDPNLLNQVNYNQTLALSLTAEEAAAYFPGQEYDMTLTPAQPA